HFPEQLPRYRRLYAAGTNAPETYRRRVVGRLKAIRSRYGLEGLRRESAGRYRPELAEAPAAQLAFDLEC
ncbi:MAG: radical SAM protein, partial [Candidatus Tectimicrobiota bacterium]